MGSMKFLFLALTTVLATDSIFWKCFEKEIDLTKGFQPGAFSIQEQKTNTCSSYLAYLREGKYLFENCLHKYLCSLNPCDLHLKPEQVQLILQTFRALQQFIVICCAEYDKAFDECDVEKMYRIAERQFSLLDGEFSLQHCLTKCKQEYEKCSKQGSILCDKDKNYLLPGPALPYSCVLPSFCINPIEFMKCTPTIDIELFSFLIVQVKVAARTKPQCDWDNLCLLERLFDKCCLIQSQVAIVRIKICIIAIITDLRTNMLDCSFKKYCDPLLCDDNNNFACNIDPALYACFGFSPQ